MKLINGCKNIDLHWIRRCMVLCYLRYSSNSVNSSFASNGYYLQFTVNSITLWNQVNVSDRDHASYLEGHIPYYMWKVHMVNVSFEVILWHFVPFHSGLVLIIFLSSRFSFLGHHSWWHFLLSTSFCCKSKCLLLSKTHGVLNLCKFWPMCSSIYWHSTW